MNAYQQQQGTSATAIRWAGGTWRAQAFTILLVAVLAVFINGCGGLPLQSQASAKRTYLLQSEATSGVSVAVDAGRCLSLRVSTPASAPGYGTARMAYTTESLRLDYFAYHEWVDSPARMIGTMMETHLEAGGLLGAVVSGSSDIRTDLRLDSELKSLQQDFKGAGSTVGLTIKVSLVDVSSRSLVNLKTFSYTETADGANPEAGVAAANRAMDRFLAELTVFVADSLARLQCPAKG